MEMARLAQVARAFNRVYGLRLTVRGEMEVAYQGERLTPSMCGRMDQVHVPSDFIDCVFYTLRQTLVV